MKNPNTGIKTVVTSPSQRIKIILEFTMSALVVTENTINTLCRALNIGLIRELSVKEQLKLERLLVKLPIVAYNSSNKHKQKKIEEFRNVLKKIHNEVKPQGEQLFSFLKQNTF